MCAERLYHSSSRFKRASHLSPGEGELPVGRGEILVIWYTLGFHHLSIDKHLRENGVYAINSLCSKLGRMKDKRMRGRD